MESDSEDSAAFAYHDSVEQFQNAEAEAGTASVSADPGRREHAAAAREIQELELKLRKAELKQRIEESALKQAEMAAKAAELNWQKSSVFVCS